MHNENRSRQTQTASNSVTNLNLQDTSGVTLGQSSGNTITVTDQGALRAGVDIASAGFDFGTDALSLADRATGRSLQFAEYAQNSSHELVRDAIAESVNFADRQAGRVAEAYDMAGDHSESAFQRAFEFGRDLFGSSLNTVTGVLREGQAQLGNTVTNLNAIARQQSTSEAERVQDLASKTLYVGIGMVALVALAMFAMRASR
jgi:hypothetical protein